jgi:hypothetical protein
VRRYGVIRSLSSGSGRKRAIPLRYCSISTSEAAIDGRIEASKAL